MLYTNDSSTPIMESYIIKITIRSEHFFQKYKRSGSTVSVVMYNNKLSITPQFATRRGKVYFTLVHEYELFYNSGVIAKQAYKIFSSAFISQ